MPRRSIPSIRYEGGLSFMACLDRAAQTGPTNPIASPSPFPLDTSEALYRDASRTARWKAHDSREYRLQPDGRAGMVRSVAEGAFTPARHLLEEIGDMMILTGRTISSALRPPYPYGDELVSQFLFALRLVWFPLLISTVCLCYAAPGLQAANFLTIFGALDRLGGFFVLGAVREIGPSVTAIVLAGVAGTAITADLGARKVREELDALQVLGVDPVKNLVVPRFLALMVATGLFDIYAVLFGLFGGILADLLNGGSLGPFWATLFESSSTTDLWGSELKAVLYGAIISIVCCYKGMSASGGAEGVGRAVNEAVVIAFLGIGAFGYV